MNRNFPPESANWSAPVIGCESKQIKGIASNQRTEWHWVKREIVAWAQIAFVAGMLCGMLAAHVSGAESMTVTVLECHDADTLWVQNGTEKQKVRLAWVDAPELSQPYGDIAQKYAAKLLVGKTVIVSYGKAMSYGRIVGQVKLADGSGYNATLVQAGFAWVDERYSKNKMLLQLQADAKAAKRGLWKDSSPIPPWVWRKTKH